MSSSKQLRFALLGTGNIAGKYVAAIKNVEQASLDGVIATSPAKAKSFAETHGIAHWAETMPALCRQVDFDALIVATPSGLHAEGVILAAKHGKHALCEKPLDIALDKIDAMSQACQEAKVKLACAFQHRTVAHNRLAYDAIQAGQLGQIYIANAFLKNFRGQEYYDSGAWRGTWDLDGGGPFMQQAVHTLDLMVWMMGPAESVFAVTDRVALNIEVEDMGHAIVKYQNGAQGVLEASTVVKPGYPNRIEIHGAEGSVILSEEGIVHWDVAGMAEPILADTGAGSGAKDPMAIGTQGHEQIIADFIEAIAQDRQPLVCPESARLSVALIQAIYESARTHATVRL